MYSPWQRLVSLISKPKTIRKTRPFRPILESLERRDLLSAAPLPDLRMAGTAYDNAHILVRFRTDAQQPVALQGTQLGHSIGLVSGLWEVNLNNGVTVEQALAAYRASS